MRETQKERERRGLETFRRLSADFPEGKSHDGETPDFTVEGSTGNVGIELVEYLKDRGPSGSVAMATQRRRHKILAEAQRIHAAETRSVPALVTVHWTGAPLRRPDGQRLAHELAALVAGCSLQQGVREWGFLEMPAPLRLHVHAVRAVAMGAGSEFLSPSSAWMGADRDGVQAALDHKEPTLTACKARADPCWLLVVAFGDVLEAQIVDFDEVAATEYRSSFDRAYLIDVFSQRCGPLRVRAP